eukprot:10611198-Alexandrium_andersonii.AAC.1
MRTYASAQQAKQLAPKTLYEYRPSEGMHATASASVKDSCGTSPHHAQGRSAVLGCVTHLNCE